MRLYSPHPWDEARDAYEHSIENLPYPEDPMPAKTQKQRAAMAAAAAGKSKLGIPKSVGKEFIRADKGGKLPKKK